MIGTVWHIWIGVALTAVAILTVLGLVGYYLLSVQSKKFPGGKQGRQLDL